MAKPHELSRSNKARKLEKRAQRVHIAWKEHFCYYVFIHLSGEPNTTVPWIIRLSMPVKKHIYHVCLRAYYNEGPWLRTANLAQSVQQENMCKIQATFTNFVVFAQNGGAKYTFVCEWLLENHAQSLYYFTPEMCFSIIDFDFDFTENFSTSNRNFRKLD